MNDDPTTHDHRFCRHCDSMMSAFDEETTRYDMKEVFVYDGITWNKGFICEDCYAEYKQSPDDFEDISEEDPYQPLSLFDTLHETFNPNNNEPH
jgi:hypothetical protein